MKISYNSNIEALERELKRKNIGCFAVGLAPHISNKNSVGFVDYNEFIAFLKSENIKSIFCTSLAIEVEDYYITDDVMCKVMGEYEASRCPKAVSEAIVKYNLSIESYEKQMSNLKQNMYYAVYNGFVVYIILADYVNLPEPHEQLEAILATKQAEIVAEREQQAALFEEQKVKLKQKILADPAFYQCTNQKLRRSYIDQLIPHLSNEYSLIKKKWTYADTGFASMDARNFIDLLWNEYKETKQ